MKVSDNLFHLIKSMSKPEKGYFKKYASMHTIGEQNNYVMLFDLIEKQSGKKNVYDENKIKAELSDKLVRQLPVMKNYLYSSVLEALQLFHAQSRKDAQVNSMLEQIDILTRKLMNDQAYSLLKKAKRIAEEYEYFPELIKLLSWEKRILHMISEPGEFEKHFKRVCIEETEALKKMQNVNEFANLRFRLSQFTSIHGTGFTRDGSEKEFFEALLNEPILQSEEYALTRINKRLYNHFKSNVYSYLNDVENTEKFQLKYIKYAEQDIDKATTYQPLLAALNNLLTMQIRHNKYDGAEYTLDKIKNFEKIYSVSLNEYEKAFAVYAYVVLGLSYCMARMYIEKGLEIVNYGGEFYKEYGDKMVISRKLIFYYFQASFLFMAGKYEMASSWLARIIQLPATDFSSDYQCYARLMNLIVHYELKNFDHLDYVMKSTYYFLRKRKKIYKYEDIVIKYMKRSLRMRSEAELTELFNEMKHELEAIYKDDYEKFGFDAFNIIPWLQSKITKKSMQEILTNRAQ
jgi:hypothetical protein